MSSFSARSSTKPLPVASTGVSPMALTLASNEAAACSHRRQPVVLSKHNVQARMGRQEPSSNLMSVPFVAHLSNQQRKPVSPAGLGCHATVSGWLTPPAGGVSGSALNHRITATITPQPQRARFSVEFAINTWGAKILPV